MTKNLTIREATVKDIDLIADYWLKSDKDFLVSMGVDLNKLPERAFFHDLLAGQFTAPYKQKQSYALIAELQGEQIGHCNVNQITFGIEATMHLHLWNSTHRKQGLGSRMVALSLPLFFENLELQTIWCEPYAHNPAPNKTLEKSGFEFEKKYRTIPGSLNFEQEVNRWKLTREKYSSFDIQD